VALVDEELDVPLVPVPVVPAVPVVAVPVTACVPLMTMSFPRIE
jgi:hypothetical protein